MSVTREIVYARETVQVPSGKLVPFVARVHRVRTRKGREYSVLRMTVPKEAGQALNVETNEFLFVMAQKAQWYHMIDWTQMPEAWARLPQEMQGLLQLYGLVPTTFGRSTLSVTVPHPPLTLGTVVDPGGPGPIASTAP